MKMEDKEIYECAKKIKEYCGRNWKHDFQRTGYIG